MVSTNLCGAIKPAEPENNDCHSRAFSVRELAARKLGVQGLAARELSIGESKARQLERLFEETFYHSYNTLLKGGATEPLYQPSTEGQPHVLSYREDYVSSALHEIAHWCLAGAKRRELVDFGYWYMPDGRDGDQQRLFEQVEVRPQALEWIFSEAAGHAFNFSADNLDGDSSLSHEFSRAVAEQVRSWCRDGLPQRAADYMAALSVHFGISAVLDVERYDLSNKVTKTAV